MKMHDQFVNNWVVMWYYDLMLGFLWNLCKLQTSTNHRQPLGLMKLWIQLNDATLLIHLSLVAQFLNCWEENNSFS